MTKRFKDFWSDYGVVVIVAIILLTAMVCAFCLNNDITVSDTTITNQTLLNTIQTMVNMRY